MKPRNAYFLFNKLWVTMKLHFQMLYIMYKSDKPVNSVSACNATICNIGKVQQSKYCNISTVSILHARESIDP